MTKLPDPEGRPGAGTRGPAVAASPRAVALGTLVAFAIALVVLSIEAGHAEFEGDEADYVATSRYFGYLFLQRDVGRGEWGDNHWTRTQPPLTRYVVGAWLTAHGQDLEQLNQPYVSTARSVDVNRQKGRVPDDQTLARARQPMVILGTGAIALLYPLASLLGGPLAGAAAAALALSSPFLRYTLVHVWAEAPLAFFLLLAALLAALGARRVFEGRPWGTWSLLAGLALGLACSTKLTGGVGVIATVLGAVAVATVARRARGPTDRPELATAPAADRRLAAWAILAAILAAIVFVALNPYLWRGPIHGVAGMLRERQEEMAAQQRQWPEYAVLDARDRPALAVVGSLRFGPWSEGAVSSIINLALVTVAGVVLGSLVRTRQSPPGGWPALAMILTWLSLYLVAITAGLGLSYPRYFLPSCLLVLPFGGLGLAAVLRIALARVTRGSRPVGGGLVPRSRWPLAR